jgi:hypothetical protein
MNRIKIIYIAVFCTVCAFFIDVHNGRSAELGDTSYTGEEAEIEALEWGFKFASAIPLKPHVVDRSKSQYSVLKAYLEMDMPGKVIKFAGRIADWRRCLLFADLAVYFAENDQNIQAKQYIERAGECRNKLQGFQASWQQERILLRIAEAQVTAGQWEMVEKTEAELPPEVAALTTALRFSRGEMDNPADFNKRLDELRAMEASEHFEVQRDVARAYIAILNRLGAAATEEQCTTLKTRVYELAGKLPLLLQNETLFSLGHAAFNSEKRELGYEVLNYTLEKFKHRELNPRYDVALLSALAQIWDEAAGESPRAESTLQDAADLLKKSSLKSADRVNALISIGKGYGLHGDANAAWDCFFQALRTAGMEKNSRPRAMMATNICIGIAQWGVPLTNDMTAEFSALYRSLANPW